VIQFVRRNVVTLKIAPIVGEPKFFGLRMSIETHRVANAASEDFEAAAVRFHPFDQRVTIRIGLANIARRAHRHIEPTVGTEGNKLPAVVLIGWENYR
jgi:hypothetical protein